MKRLLACLFLLALPAGAAHAYVDISPTLGYLIKDSETITVLEIDKLSIEKKVIVFKKVFDLKGKTGDSPVRHHIGAGFHPREPHIVLDWAEVGNRCVVFTTDNVALVCIGTYWYQLSARADGWWSMTTGRPELAVAYYGTALKLRRAIADILEGKEVVITAVNHGAKNGVYQYQNVAFQKVLRGRDCPVWRIKASLEMPDSVWRVSVKDSPWIVGPGAAGPEDIPKLAAALDSKGPRTRAQAAEDLGLVGWKARSTLPQLTKACEDVDGFVRVNAGMALCLINEEPDKGLPVVIACLKHETPRVRREAAEALGDLGQMAKKAVPALREALKDNDHGVRWAAAEALGRIGPLAQAAVPDLAEGLRDKTLRVIAADALGGIGAASRGAVPLLVDGVKDSDPEFQWTSAVALSRIDPPSAKVALPLFIEKLKTGDLRMRWDAMAYITPMGRDAYEAADAIRPAVKRGNGMAAQTLALIAGPDGYEALRVLLGVLEDEWDTTEHIAAIGPKAVPEVIELLRDPKKTNHHLAVKALGLLAPQSPEAMAAVIGALRSQEASVRQAAATALGNLKDPPEVGVQGLRTVLRDEAPAVRLAAATALRKLGATDLEAAVQSLAELLSDKLADVRREAAATLGDFGAAARNATLSLTTALKDPDGAVRSAAAGALARISAGQAVQEALPVLIAALRDADPRARQEAARVLGGMGPEAQAAASALTQARQDDDDDVRRSANEALAKIQPR